MAFFSVQGEVIIGKDNIFYRFFFTNINLFFSIVLTPEMYFWVPISEPSKGFGKPLTNWQIYSQFMNSFLK
jgi:hypothetical protein